MFLIEFKENQFIDAERIIHLSISYQQVRFTVNGKPGEVYEVDGEIEAQFLNQLQALNQSLTNPEARHHHINNPDTKY
jgi:hypothetical protein